MLLFSTYFYLDLTIQTMIGIIPVSLLRLIMGLDFLYYATRDTFSETVAAMKQRKRLLNGLFRGFSIGTFDFFVHIIAVVILQSLGATNQVLWVAVSIISIGMTFVCLELFRKNISSAI